MALFPVFPPLADPSPLQTQSRPTPPGGCLSFVRYWRYPSNNLREYGPFVRVIDRAKLALTLTYDEIVTKDRYAVAYKLPLLGVVESQRYDFQDMVYPFNGLSCPAAAG
jgi:hypothetical protein